MKAAVVAVLGFLGLVQGVTVDDFYPFNPQLDHRLPNGNSGTSHRIALSVPAKFYDKEYDYLWISIDGYISFEADTSDVAESDFPFNEPLLSPFMADLDTTSYGEVYYKENNEAVVLSRATADVRLAFPVAAADFDAESAFIVTWKGVEGRSVDGTTAKFTFQAIIVSNGRDSYAIFLYPERMMGVVPAGVRMKSDLFQARAGFNQGRAQFLEMYPVERLVDHRNTHRNGEWIFQIGGEGVINNHEVVAPENVRPVKRQTTVMNVQEVDFGDEDAEEEPPTRASRYFDYCARATEACLAPNSECVNHRNGYCCRCLPDFYGNGKVCVPNDEPLRVNGNVTGTVDVRSADGSVTRESLNNVNFHSYVITLEGRAHVAVSDVPPALGRALQPISAIAEIIGWLFAIPSAPAVNGFQFTGGSFQRQVNIRFSNSDYHFSMRQRFLGVREEGDSNLVVAHTNFVGLLPDIPENAAVKMSNYEEYYEKKGAGRISSTSVRNYTVDDTSHSYTITQNIIFNECRDSISSVPDKLELLVTGIFLKYHDNDNNVRHAMTDKITAADAVDPAHPCSSGRHNCDATTSECEPGEGEEFTCLCRRGYAGSGGACVDIDECLNRPCDRNEDCVNNQGSYSCFCRSGYERNEETRNCEVSCPGNQIFSECAGCVSTCEERFQLRPCTLNCRVQCTCPDNTYLDGDMCVTADECPSEQSAAQCLQEYDDVLELLRESPDLLNGPELPTCLPDGSFAPKQCSAASGTCWCVHPENGTVIPGTMARGPSGVPLECDVSTEATTTAAPLTHCLRARAEVERLRRENPGLQDGPEAPECDSDGLYVRKQCNYFTQICWCVDPETGTPIPGGPRGRAHTNDINCVSTEATTTAAPLTHCLRARAEVERLRRENPGLQDGPEAPECDSDGLYVRKQCNYFTQICWCVDPETGTRIPGGPRGRAHTNDINCDPIQTTTTAAPLTRCRQEYAQVDDFNRRYPEIQDGRQHPQCDSDGLYRRKQCNLLTDVCWCVEPTDGVIVPNTITDLGAGSSLDCDIPACTKEYNEAVEWTRQHPGVQDGADYPECDANGLFERRQCNDWTRYCWCVDPQTGSTIPGRENTEDCSDSPATAPTPQLTQCQIERATAGQSSSGSPVFVPICTGAGAYEPMQYHPAGYYICVDRNGREVSRHQTQPECLTQCELQRYYADTGNEFLHTSDYVPQCDESGGYSDIQCDQSTSTCFCADASGQEIQGTRVSTDQQALLSCRRTPPPTDRSRKLVFANARSINLIDLPMSDQSRATRFYDRAGRMAVGVAFDCSSQNIYWTDVATRAIYKAPIGNARETRVVVSGLRSPEGIAVDFITGNIFWTDSGLDRIEVARSNGSSRAVLVSSGLRNPRGIAVDPFGGKMYWVDWDRQNPRVMSAYLNGDNVETLVSGSQHVTLPNDIAIDPYFRRLCYIDAARIKCMDLDGSNRRTVWTNSAPGKPFGVAVYANKVYYSNRIRSPVTQVKRVYEVDTASQSSVGISGPFGVHSNAYGLAVAFTECPSGYNHCSGRNGDCSHLCLATPSGRSCKCPNRMVATENGLGCQ